MVLPSEDPMTLAAPKVSAATALDLDWAPTGALMVTAEKVTAAALNISHAWRWFISTLLEILQTVVTTICCAAL